MDYCSTSQPDTVSKRVDFHISYLHLHLIRIDLLVRSAVRRWQLAGQDFGEKFRGLFISETNLRDLLNRPIGGGWGAGVALPQEEDASLAALQEQVQQEILRLRAEAQSSGMDLNLERMPALFGLSDFELDAFLVCLAPMIDTRYERIYAYLQDDVTRRYASLDLVFDLLLPAGLGKVRSLESFVADAPLLKFGLLQPAPTEAGADTPPLRQSFTVPAELITWLQGGFQPDRSLAPAMRLCPPPADASPLAEMSGLPAETASLLPEKPLIVLYGPDALQQQMAAEAISALAGRPLLQLDLAKLDTAQFSAHHTNLFLRDCRLASALPAVAGWDALDAENHEPGLLFERLSQHNDLVLLHAQSEWPLRRATTQPGKPVAWVSCQGLPAARRLQVWEHFLPAGAGVAATDLELLAGQFSLAAGQIRDAAFAARDLAFQQQRSLTPDDLYTAARRYSSSHLSSLAIKVEPRYRWEDIVLPEDELKALREIASTIRWRPLVLGDWGLGERLMPYGGVSALFAGPPGTGKTLAAQVIAAELKMDLYKIDLSTVVSKYIGETEKNLERIFSQAKDSNAILFFDEADAIFGKRSEVKDAHDRYANIEVGYLLQRMETYDGVVILATNLRANLDEAFTRRIHFIVDFPFPDEKERGRIWQVLFPPGVPRTEDLNFSDLGNRFRLAGGSIRSVIISASFLAASEQQPVSSRHLLHAVRREMQKMGRLVHEKDLSLSGKDGNNGNNAA